MICDIVKIITFVFFFVPLPFKADVAVEFGRFFLLFHHLPMYPL